MTTEVFRNTVGAEDTEYQRERIIIAFVISQHLEIKLRMTQRS